MNIKKIIKCVAGLGAVGGIAYAAYKFGECNGEANAKSRDKYGDDLDDFDEDDDEDMDNYYGTCFEHKYDEPDDGCVAPNKFKIDPDKDAVMYVSDGGAID